jgi:UDP-N-acetylmuramoyl-tripeptide--D-alanyl-D-alanine ligase
VATDAGVDGALALKLLSQVEPVQGRMRRVELGTHVLFDDAYNANPSSMLAALEELARQPGRRLAVLGRMGELGPTSADWHQKMGAAAARLKLELLAVAAPEIFAGFQHAGGATGSMAPDLPSALQSIRERLTIAETNTLLIKASHSAGLYQLVADLVPNSSANSSAD